MALTAFAGGALFGRRHGADTPRVLALHGWQRDHHDWDAALEGLDAVALDLPGFGASPAPPEPWGSEGYATAVAPVLDGMAERVVLAGHSFGGRVALQLAAARPERVAGLLLSGVPNLVPRDGPAPRPPMAYRVVRRLHRWGLVSADRMEARRRKHGSRDYNAAHGVMRDVLVRVVNESYHDLLPRVDAPVEMVWGEHDSAAGVEMATSAAERLRATLTVVPDVDHFVPTAAHREVRAALDRLLGGHG